MSRMSRQVSGRTAECPFAKELSLIASIARAMATGIARPVPQLCALMYRS